MLRENSKSNAIELPINRGFSYEKKKKKEDRNLERKIIPTYLNLIYPKIFIFTKFSLRLTSISFYEQKNHSNIFRILINLIHVIDHKMVIKQILTYCMV